MLFLGWENIELEPENYDFLSLSPSACILHFTCSQVPMAKVDVTVFEFFFFISCAAETMGTPSWELDEILCVTVATNVQLGLNNKNQEILTF